MFSHSFNFDATCDDNLVTPKYISTLYTERSTVLAKVKNVFFDNFDYQKLWETITLMVCFNTFNFSRLLYRIFIDPMFSLTWLKKNSVLLFISFLLMIIGFLKKFWRLKKQILLKMVIAQSPVYFMVLMLIS